MRLLELQIRSWNYGDGVVSSHYSIHSLCIVQASHPNQSISVSKVLDRLKNYPSTLHQRSNLLYKFLQINFTPRIKDVYLKNNYIIQQSPQTNFIWRFKFSGLPLPTIQV